MSIDAIHEFVSELRDHFVPPKHGSAEAEAKWLRSIVEALRGSAPAVLTRASRDIIEGRKNRYFPLIAEIREACREAATEIDFETRLQSLPELRKAIGGEWSDERVKLAYDLIKSGMGREAARDGWVLALWNFCRQHQRLPQGQETERCKKDAKEFDQAYAQCVRGNAGPVSKSLEGLGASMLAKREKLRAEVLGR